MLYLMMSKNIKFLARKVHVLKIRRSAFLGTPGIRCHLVVIYLYNEISYHAELSHRTIMFIMPPHRRCRRHYVSGLSVRPDFRPDLRPDFFRLRDNSSIT